MQGLVLDCRIIRRHEVAAEAFERDELGVDVGVLRKRLRRLFRFEVYLWTTREVRGLVPKR